MEIWKPIKEFEDCYLISNHGRLKRLARYIPAKINCVDKVLLKEMILKNVVDGPGYCFKLLSKNCYKKRYKIHRLVALHFIPNPLNKPQINHKDGNKLNNHVDNLEWCTCSENCKHSFKIGLQNNQGENCPTSKLNNNQVIEIRKKYLSGKYNQTILGQLYNITRRNINDIINNKTWNHI